MTRPHIHIVVFVAFLMASSGGAAADTEPSQQVMLKITLSDHNSGSAEHMVSAEPTIAVTLGRPFSFRSGGELSTGDGGDAIEVGTRVRGIVKKREGNSLVIALKIAVG